MNMGHDIDQMLQAEMLKQERLRTLAQEGEMEAVADATRFSQEGRADWGVFIRVSLAVLGVAGLVVGSIYGISWLFSSENDPCVESHFEKQYGVYQKQTGHTSCEHPDHKITVKDYPEQCGIRLVQVTCTCPGVAP